jgi:hypothetical protein
LYLNSKGQYQVPTLQDHTAKTYLHTFKPMEQSGMAMGMTGTIGTTAGAAGMQMYSNNNNYQERANRPYANPAMNQAANQAPYGSGTQAAMQGSPSMLESVDQQVMNYQNLNQQQMTRRH